MSNANGNGHSKNGNGKPNGKPKQRARHGKLDDRRSHAGEDFTAYELKVYFEWIGGRAQYDLAQENGVSQVSISNLVTDIGHRLAPIYARQIDKFRAEAIARCMTICQREMGAWVKSEGEQIETTETTTETDKGGYITTAVKTYRSSGNPNHHKTAIAAMELTTKLLGIEPPKIEGDGTLSSIGKTRKELIAEILASANSKN